MRKPKGTFLSLLRPYASLMIMAAGSGARITVSFRSRPALNVLSGFIEKSESCQIPLVQNGTRERCPRVPCFAPRMGLAQEEAEIGHADQQQHRQ